MNKKSKDEQASGILANSALGDKAKLLAIFELYKDEIRNFNVNLYYALLGWVDDLKTNDRAVVSSIKCNVEYNKMEEN